MNLNLLEKGELSVLKQWVNDLHFVGEFEPISQIRIQAEAHPQNEASSRVLEKAGFSK